MNDFTQPQSRSTPTPPQEVVELGAVDHIFIQDLDSGEIILNKRGDAPHDGNNIDG